LLRGGPGSTGAAIPEVIPEPASKVAAVLPAEVSVGRTIKESFGGLVAAKVEGAGAALGAFNSANLLSMALNWGAKAACTAATICSSAGPWLEELAEVPGSTSEGVFPLLFTLGTAAFFEVGALKGVFGKSSMAEA